MDRGRITSRWLAAAAVGAFAVLLGSPAIAVTGAAFTTTNTSIDGAGHCGNGNENVNCNIYEGKQYVWLSGGPATTALGAGTYFFAVVAPSGQGSNQNPNDGTPNNLSDPSGGDDWQCRIFDIDSNGKVSYPGTGYACATTPHEYDSVNWAQGKIRALPYDDTPNPGGVYILAICKVPGSPGGINPPGVTPSACKYDAFKVLPPPCVENCGGGDAGQPLPSAVKTAAGADDKTYAWTITKAVDKTLVQQVGGTATFNYTVTLTHDSGTVSGVDVTGMITVTNPGAPNTNPITLFSITDLLSDGTSCDVTSPSTPGGPLTVADLTIAAGATTNYPYTCTLSALPVPIDALSNTATITWDAQNGPPDQGGLPAGSLDTLAVPVAFTEDIIDECIDATDAFNGGAAGALGKVCVGDPNPKVFTYSRTVNIPQFACVSYKNTAAFTTEDTGATGSASKTVTVCGPANTGALTIGFWKGPNGQGLITTYCGSPALANYLKSLGGGSGPFSNAPTTSCKDLAGYVSSILTAASATDMNKMLKAQMLGSALDVWFSGAGWTSTTLNKIKPPSGFLSHNSLGTFKMDTTAVCPMVDNTTTGTATCQGNKPSTDAVASGAVPSSPMTMQAILDFAATVPAPFNGSTSSSVWYAGNRTKQEILKNIFDQFNNQMAFGSF